METSRCRTPTVSNTSLSSVSFLVFSAFEALLGMALNAFLVAESCIHGLKNRELKSIDKILTALGTTRFCYLQFFLVKVFWMSISTRVFEVTSVYQMFKAAIWFLTCTSFCFSACLCSFYCIKIANFGHRLFVLLKLRISKLVPWMLLAAVLGSLVNTYPFFQGIYSRNCKNSTASTNQTLEDFTWETNLLSLFVHCSMGFSVAFCISFASSGLLLFSLWRHAHQMQSGWTGFDSPSMAAHFQAVKTIGLLLIVDSVNFLGLMLLLSNVFSETGPTYQLITILVYICPSAQSQVIIWGNPRLKRAFVRLTNWIRHTFLV
ncbi:taste receptor type 2 member 40-like [Paroedura picta]|uniref:taste receptor type 2 member 40-like n=1 Tax=Paroedura picta TaxID=143630 RepID=UPI00405702ED